MTADLPPCDRLAIERAIKRQKKNQRLVRKYKAAKGAEWQTLKDAFDEFWQGSGYLDHDVSSLINDLQGIMHHLDCAITKAGMTNGGYRLGPAKTPRTEPDAERQ